MIKFSKKMLYYDDRLGYVAASFSVHARNALLTTIEFLCLLFFIPKFHSDFNHNLRNPIRDEQNTPRKTCTHKPKPTIPAS